MTELTITVEAQLNEANSLVAHLRTRCMILSQQLLNQEAETKALKSAAVEAEAAHSAALEEIETGLLARIAGLEDDLRIAQSAFKPTEVSNDGEC
ncbi:hypothetical protein [Rhizobium sp. CC-YZS058]|uniref:hypothetical protein n=1 Tax=Rhizobium sp. CC-YZS058 TaxID=3042153 RepID=UPI002B0578C0|nr:hypothetical protein [Rhizobium sp. CC-YZS058]MEA3533734.1 hypothetical protein [Rhizobium sp. CC-YZS058]